MEPSTLSLEVSPIILSQNATMTIKGQINPELDDENVTLYAKINSAPWMVIGSALTQPDGSFEVVWKSETGGLYAIQASWSGDEQYTGALSPTKNATVMPNFLGGIIVAILIAVGVGTFVFFMAKHAKHAPIENRMLN